MSPREAMRDPRSNALFEERQGRLKPYAQASSSSVSYPSIGIQELLTTKVPYPHEILKKDGLV